MDEAGQIHLADKGYSNMILTRISPIAKDTIAKNLFSDPLLKVSMIYKRFMSNVYNPETGPNVITEDLPIIAVKMKHTNDSVKASSFKVEVGMTLFLLQYDDLPFTPSLKDTMVEVLTGKEYAFKGLDPIFNILYSVTVADKRSPS